MRTASPGGIAKRVLEAALAGLLAVLLAGVVLGLCGAVHGPASALFALAGVALGVLLTDFISGLVHWLCDTYGDEQTRLLGPLLIAPFREHHRHPQRMLERGFLEVNLSNSAGAVAVLLLARAAGWPGPDGALGGGFLAGLAAAIYLTNTFHQWAHDPRPPPLARVLQASRLAIDPRRHARHHARGYGAFCITTGWLNPLLDGSSLFQRAERLIARFGAARPALPPPEGP